MLLRCRTEAHCRGDARCPDGWSRLQTVLGIGDDPGIIHWNSRDDVSEVCGAQDFDGAKRELGDVGEDSYLVFYSFAVGFAHADCRR